MAKPRFRPGVFSERAQRMFFFDGINDLISDDFMSKSELLKQYAQSRNIPVYNIPNWAKTGFTPNATQSKLYNERVVEYSKKDEGAIDVSYTVVIEGIVKYERIPWYI